MKAAATLAVERVDGVTRLVRLAGEPPLVLRPTGTHRGRLRVHLAAGAGGPCQGDALLLRVRVGAAAQLELRSVAATVVLPGARGGTSRWRTEIDVGDEGLLLWKPEPLVAAAGSEHVADTVVRLAPTARVLVREELVAGRTGERSGNVHAGLRVERAGRALFDQELHVAPDEPPGPRLRAVGTLVAAASDGAAPRTQQLLGQGFLAGGPAAQAVVAPLAQPGAYAVTALAPDAATLRALLRRAEAVCAGVTARDARRAPEPR